jgi:gliding motility-associated-like protein
MGLSCDTCSKTNASPYTTTTYTAVVSSTVNHCSDTGSITITVLDIREVYVPNIFNPHDENGRNDFFTVYGGAEVKKIVSLKVWSRWGELVFNGENFEPNTASKGWDGTSRNKTVNPGVFTWQASVEFVDGKMQTLTGNVTLL